MSAAISSTSSTRSSFSGSSIWLSLRIEKTLTRVEDNRKVLADMEIYHAQKTVELAGLSRMSKVQAMLEESGSKLTMPEKPADRLNE